MSHEIARNWRLKDQRLRLEGEVCPEGHFVFPPRDICPNCSQEAKKKVTLSGKGTVYSYTVIQEAPAGFEEFAPYVVALVQLEEGPLITAQLTDLEIKHGKRMTKVDQERGWPDITIEVETTDFDVHIGMPVEMVTRKYGDDGDKKGIINYGYKFRPPISAS